MDQPDRNPTSRSRRGRRVGPTAVPAVPARPLLVCAREELLDVLLRLAAAAGVECDVVPDLIAAIPAWNDAPLVVVDDEVLAAAVGVPARREDVVLVVRSPDDHDVWQRAVRLGAEHVVVLPEAEPWLVDRLTDLGEGPGRIGRLVGVVGGRGGAGASTLAAALAVTGVANGEPTMLIDLDPLGGGIDLALGLEGVSGLRWADLSRARGRLNGTAMRDALPRAGELPVLAWDRGDDIEVPLDAARSVCEAALRTCSLVVVDLPRSGGDAAAHVATRADEILVVVPAEVRAVASAERVLRRYRMYNRQVRAVVRGPAPAGVDAAAIGLALDVEIAAQLRPERGLARALERGDPPGLTGRGPLAEFARSWLDGAA